MKAQDILSKTKSLMRVNLLWSLIDRILESGHIEERDDEYAAGLCANEVESTF